MKKIFLFIAVASAISLTSCKKDRVCTCTSTSTEPGSTPDIDKVTYLDVSKTNATSKCIGSSQEYKGKDDKMYTITNKCELK